MSNLSFDWYTADAKTCSASLSFKNLKWLYMTKKSKPFRHVKRYVYDNGRCFSFKIKKIIGRSIFAKAFPDKFACNINRASGVKLEPAVSI
ncbi:hypothetical protein BpHYR1_024548 [Brachionus plicatilis]|uniref:Uncharacterized protein n=1 Tax=Brachionus plicatilis TaxID=10195 RepID=A0A3M7T570_BRAPC|nr:hypothetical protein BpHYR1_024548 [Brachionus plicatilis]